MGPGDQAAGGGGLQFVEAVSSALAAAAEPPCKGLVETLSYGFGEDTKQKAIHETLSRTANALCVCGKNMGTINC